MADISLDTANFFGLLLSVWLYGLFLRMFLASIWPLWTRRHRSGGRFIVAVTLWLFVTATSHIVISVAKGYDRFIECRDVAEYSEADYLLKVTIDGWIFLLAIWNVEVILIWRLWVVWSGDWRVTLLPIVLFTIEFVVGMVPCFQIGPSKAFDNAYHGARSMEEKIVASVCLCLVNAICTPFVIARLWWIGRRAQIPQTRSLYRTVAFRLVESGSLYTVASLVWISFHLPSGRMYPGYSVFINYMFQMIVAVAPMMIFKHLSQKIVPEVLNINIPELQCREDVTRPGRLPSDAISTVIAFRPSPPGDEP
ncbi:hypothetical protein FRB94_012275 [Tulasnella sp. JGI-2019a]|nr:hypothetical protein FRB93_010440 [Tulasnella sp. JGI-2019a]KAG8991779.1 hypothetical protein FRB94_012275 [Tulasnella sp. JGI-2019a]KAG9023925.1 hypothetical protein FRB95_012308 [Tulasnella sp. JGI-2019a]